MGRVALNNFAVGAVIAAVIATLGFVPIIGPIISFSVVSYVIYIGFWIWLANRIVGQGKVYLAQSENPRVPAMMWTGGVGAATGLIGALVGFIIDATAKGGTLQGFSAVGALLALFLYPLFGLIWGGIFGLIWGGNVTQVRSV